MKALSSFAKVSMRGGLLPFFWRKEGLWAGRVSTDWLARNLFAAHFSQLADAPGTGRVVQGEHLTIHYLSPFEVTVVAHRTALAIRVEGVGTGDGTVHR